MHRFKAVKVIKMHNFTCITDFNFIEALFFVNVIPRILIFEEYSLNTDKSGAYNFV